MWTYDKTEAARKHRLTITMCLVLLEISRAKPSTVRALVARGLVNLDPAGGWWISEAGQRVAEALAAEVHDQARESSRVLDQEHAEGDCPILNQGGCANCQPEGQESADQDDAPEYTGPRIGDEVTDGTDDGIVRELAARSGTAGAVVDFPVRSGGASNTEARGGTPLPEGSRWVPLGDLTVTTDRAPLEPSPEDDDGPVGVEVVEPRTTVAAEISRGDLIEHNGEQVTVTDVGSAGADVVISLGARRALTMPPTTPVRRCPAQLSLIA